jgi:hypothetical protein
MKEKEYKNRIKKLFYNSVKTDLKLWTFEDGYIHIRSPKYNDVHFIIYNDFLGFSELRLEYSRNTSEKICIFLFLGFIPMNFKVLKYVNILKKERKYRKNSEKEEILKLGLENIEKKFVKEIRKDKLNEINEN